MSRYTISTDLSAGSKRWLVGQMSRGKGYIQHLGLDAKQRDNTKVDWPNSARISRMRSPDFNKGC